MSAPSWPELEALFHEALARPPAERAPFLAERCAGRPDLQGEVEALLRAHERTASALEVPLTLQTQLKAGMRLGSYEVLSELGAGSMGEVYRARDTRLGRDVAIKVLPALFLSDPERRARFEREARLLASLNHPHIAAIYGVEETGATLALVLELVEGPTLAEVIARGPLPLERALPLAQQVAEALEAAHEKKIVHRDLKPANIKITPAGVVKVLDFGIAKVAAADGSRPDLSHSPSITATTPREGVILGTAAYMSPEQARGHAVDKRTDIWAFGCVVYEMLTGRQAFPGETLSDTLAAVLQREPDWDALPAHTPTLIRRLLRRCLGKERKGRLADISDARLDIEEALSTPSSTEGSRVSRSSAWRLVIALIAGLIVGGIVAASALWRGTRGTVPRVTRTMIIGSGPEALNVSANDRDLAISPDGSRVVYIGAKGSQLFVRAMNELDATAIASGAPRHPFFSPDGQWVGFFDGQQTIKKVAITGGPVVTICRRPPGGPRGATWGPDGTIIFATIGPGLWAVPADGGQPAMLTMPDPQRGESNHWLPEFLPGGQAVLFTIRGPNNTFEVAVLDRRTGARKILVRDASDAHYAPSGHLVYATAGTLRATAFDLGRLEVRGTPVPVLDDVVTTPFGAADFDVASDGTLAYVTGSAQALKRVVVLVDRHGVQEPIAAPARSYTAPSLSPDGLRLALDIREQEQHVWIWDFARRTLTRFSVDRTDEEYPVWTADGHRLIFASGRPGSPGVFWQTADGTGAAERLATTRTYPFLSAVSRDGSRIVFEEDADLKVLSLGNDRQVSPLVQTPFTEMNGQISPDGRWLAYQSDESGQFEIYVRPFPDVNGGRWQVSTGGGTRPVWARNGRELFFLAGARSLAPNATLMSVRVTPGTSWTADRPTKLFEGNYVAAANGRTYDVSIDGQRFVMIKPTGEEAPTNIVVVQHWLEELNAKVPVGK